MADDKKGTPVEVHIDEFLRGLQNEDAIMKHMFRHFYVKVQGIEKAVEGEFAKLFASFKDLPISALK